MSVASDIATLLLEQQAVKISTNPPFTWTSGIKSPIYCDNRLLISSVEGRKIVIDGFKQIILDQNIQFDIVAGTATAAIPWAAFLAAELDIPMTYVRTKPKGHGAGKQVEGTMKPGSKVLIVEDLFSTGGSSINSAEACRREYEADVVGALAIFSYGFPIASEGFKAAKLPFFTLSNLDTLVNQLSLSQEEKEVIKDFSADPKGWAERNGI